MSAPVVKLSEIRAARGRMDVGPWSFDEPDPPAGSVDISGAECLCDEANDPVDPPCPKHDYVAEFVTLPNARGIIATHNAADVLIEVTEAVIAHEQARKDAEGARMAFAFTDAQGIDAALMESTQKTMEEADQHEAACCERLRVALAKVAL